MWAQLIISFDHTLPEPLSVTQSEPESKGTLWFSSTFFWRGVGGGGSYELNVCTDYLMTNLKKQSF